jgi:hypothetical protein
MLLNNAPINEAIMSNVGEIGGFKIKASAKAFNILSSGLYANKIRAIIRELSCNAVDSHVAAGNNETPFDVHLPNQLEPWFSIRDYGTGLTHEQVTQIYTTYFESTKTDSNEYIGALGLGSKSPFAYTDNFTITAIRNNKKGIYSAFINQAGVPSIAQMMTEDTTEPSGVEVKMSVNDNWDYSKFRDEARTVYTYFKLRPVITGYKDFEFRDVTYDVMDIIPGVHSTDDHRSVAVMGNIAYPIDMPNADKNLGELFGLLRSGLEMHFAIGELDFQASREGLSYIPQTIASIKSKLEAVNAQLAIHIAKEADAIDNAWERALYLQNRRNSSLWSAAVDKYITDTKFDMFEQRPSYSPRIRSFDLFEADLAKRFNIVIRSFNKNKNTAVCTNNKPSTNYNTKDVNGAAIVRSYWTIPVSKETRFVINDTKVGATERAKFHWKNTPAEKDAPYSNVVYVLESADRTKPVNTKAFFRAISNPPADYILVASQLKEKARKESGLGKNVSIMKLQEKGYGGYYNQRELVWRDAGKADSFDTTETHYYLPLKGFEVLSKHTTTSFSVKQFFNDLKECGISSLNQTTIYGVRKGDIEFIKTQPNWINIEDHIVDCLKTIDSKLSMSLVVQAVDNFNLLSYNSNIVMQVTPASPYVKLVKQFENVEKVRYSEHSLKNLCRRYAPDTTWSPETLVQKYMAECKVISERYPLLAYLRSAPNKEVADYINMIDATKPV